MQVRRSSAPAIADGAGPSAGNPRLIIALLVLVISCTIAVQWPALSARAFAFDDAQYFITNPLVRNPSAASAWQFFREVLHPSTVGGYYQPLTMVSLMLDSVMGATQDNLRPLHRTSLLLHAVNSGLIVLLLYALFKQPWVAAGAGLLFGLHPITVETVAWIAERKTPLATFFALLSLLAYLKYVKNPSRRIWYPACALLFVLALLSKPSSPSAGDSVVENIRPFKPAACLATGGL